MIPLYNKSNYTLLSSLLRIDDLISYAKKNNISSMAITDSNMYGVMEFIKKCEKESIKPIIGLEIILEEGNIVLLAKNYVGYQNLMKLSTIQSAKKVEFKELERYSKDLILLIPFSSRSNNDKLKNIFIELYLGYSNKEEEKEASIISEKVLFLRETLYLKSSDYKFYPYLIRIRDGKTMLDQLDDNYKNHELEVGDLLALSSEEGLNQSDDIASSCNIVFPKYENLLPIYECDDPNKYLFDLCRLGLSKRLKDNVPDEYKKRLIKELEVIKEMGFSNYFLVVYDFIKYAKKNKILVGPGRGSAAGSLVAYTLGITDIDPLKYDLLFERFLNPERKTMPDIDTDFPDNKRDEVIQYVKNKYGEKRVSGIITFGTMAAKQVIRDVARVLNIPIYIE